jgi:hypothetical protein
MGFKDCSSEAYMPAEKLVDITINPSKLIQTFFAMILKNIFIFSK